MLKRKTIYFVSRLLASVCLTLTFISCDKENPVIPPSTNPLIVDSNFFDWHFDTLQISPMFGMYIADTNKVIIPGNHYSTYINNGSIQYISHNDNDFEGWCVNGTDINNVYIGGASISQYRTKLKRWNGVGIEDIAMPIDTSCRIISIETISENDIWISTNKSIIYHYSNQFFTTYRLDSELVDGLIYKDNIGGLYAALVKIFYGLNSHMLYMFKFENNSWIEVCKDSVSENSELQIFIGFSESKMLRSGKTGIYYFNGNKWEKYVNLGNTLRPYLACGSSAENIMFRADEGNQSYLFHYDGNRLYRNSDLMFPDPSFMSMQYKFGRFYVTINEDWMGYSYLGIAKFK